MGRKRPRSMPTGRTATRRVTPAPGRFWLNSRDTVAGSAVNGSAARVIRFERAWKRSLPCRVTTTGPSRASSAGHAVRPKCAWTTSNSPGRWRRRSSRAAAGYERSPGGKAKTSTSTSSLRRRASTWSSTKRPYSGRSGVGYMFVTTRARTPRTWHGFVTGACRSVPPAAGHSNPAPRRRGRARRTGGPMVYELMGRAHAAWAGERGQGTVEYVGLVLLMAVLIAGVVKASGSFSDTGIAEAVVKKLKGAIEGVGAGKG